MNGDLMIDKRVIWNKGDETRSRSWQEGFEKDVAVFYSLLKIEK